MRQKSLNKMEEKIIYALALSVVRLSTNCQETYEVTQAEHRCNDEIDTANLQISIWIVR